MAEAELGPSFAIHGGGSDLLFPHHENEIAQSEGAGRPFARLWMHNGMIEADAEKMSKSEGNIFQLSEALDRFGREAVIAYIVSGHYRQPLAFSEEALSEGGRPGRAAAQLPARAPPGEPAGEAAGRPSSRRFREALADDFNTPRALAEAFELVSEANRRRGRWGRRRRWLRCWRLLGLGSLAGEGGPEDAGEEVRALLAEREEARAARDFERSDRIRDQLAELGWEVRDSAEGARLIRRG